MRFQRGGFVMGLIVGLMVGLAVALGVALYVTKVPVPFINKVPQRTPEQDAAEAEKNKNWDPNSPLYGKNPARPHAIGPAASGVVAPPAAQEPAPVAVMPPPPQPPAANPPTGAQPGTAPLATSRRNPAEILNGGAVGAAGQGTTTAAASTKAGIDPFSYFVQVGAYARPEDAESQRAKLAMLGLAAKVTEREQGGRTVYRVRVGPFDHREEADLAKEKVDANGMESSLVRVQR